jgi:hypothetical protein
MNILAVKKFEKFYGVEMPDRGTVFIQDPKGPVSDFNPGWGPIFIYGGFSGLFLLELKHVDGSCATWYLNSDMRRICDRILELPESVIATIKHQGAILIQSAWDSLICKIDASIDLRVKEFFLLNTKTRMEILSISFPFMQDSIKICNINSHSFLEEDLIVKGEGSEFNLSKDYISASMDVDASSLIIDGLRKGRISFKSPVDGEVIFMTASVTLDADKRFLYRLVDRERSLVFYILVTGDHCYLSGIYFPESQIIFSRGEFGTRMIASDFGLSGSKGLRARLLEIVCSSGEILEGYLGASDNKFAIPVRGHFHTHVGVYIWSVLTGLERLVSNLSMETIPECLVAADSEEKFGDIGALLPELKNKIYRGFKNRQEIISYAFASHRCLVQVADKRVAKLIRNRVIELNDCRSETTGYEEHLKRLRSKGYPVVLLGLRVENRTVVDLKEFCGQVIDFLIRKTGGVSIILDGHNISNDAGGKAYPSDYQDAATVPPIEVEREIVAQLEAQFRGQQVELISTIGEPLSSSIFWASRADFFVTMWGAGLALYRWIGNKPGLVITSKWNINHRLDLRIYDSPEFIEDSVPMEWLPDEFVTDMPEAPLLFPATNMPLESISNFQVTMSAVLDRLQILLEKHFYVH